MEINQHPKNETNGINHPVPKADTSNPDDLTVLTGPSHPTEFNNTNSNNSQHPVYKTSPNNPTNGYQSLGNIKEPGDDTCLPEAKVEGRVVGDGFGEGDGEGGLNVKQVQYSKVNYLRRDFKLFLLFLFLSGTHL